MTFMFQLLKSYFFPLIIYRDTQPLHVISLSLNSTHKVESIAYIFRVSPKAQLFRATKNQSVITWRISDLFRSHWVLLFELPSLIVGWPFYMFYYFLNIKRWLFIVFYTQTDRQIKKHNNTIKAYLRATKADSCLSRQLLQCLKISKMSL